MRKPDFSHFFTNVLWIITLFLNLIPSMLPKIFNISRRYLSFGILSLISSLAAHTLLLACMVSPISPPQASQSPVAPLLIGAAASLQQALQEITPLYQAKTTNQKVDYNFAASGALQQQIEQGAPIDIFISAATKQIDALQQKNLLLAGTQRNLLTNQLVLITPRQGSIVLKDFRELVNPEITRIAIGEPRSVPAGQYATEVLKNLDILEQVRSKFVLASNVKGVLAAVASGDVDAGIVYLTDAKSLPQVAIAASADPRLHSPIIYPIAILKATRSPAAAQQYVDFLQSPPARKIFEQYGFGLAKS
jgi:molybdate transport system substrate-binding protein